MVLGALPQGARKTVTFDNGGEFARLQRLEAALGVAAYFCDPHSPWLRGTIENTNGILRRDLPRKTDITNYIMMFGPGRQCRHEASEDMRGIRQHLSVERGPSSLSHLRSPNRLIL
jgi:hypothetical protein